MPILEIDGKKAEVEKGTNLIIAAQKAGVSIPHYCYHPSLKVVAQCRMCMVKIEGLPRVVPACNITVDKDMKVYSDTDPEVKRIRNLVLELLLVHHPTDCPVCPRCGECELQNFTYTWGPEDKRFDGERRIKGYTRVSDRILLYKERCVLCTRCVRFLRDFAGTGGISVTLRGQDSDLEIFPDKFVDNSNYTGNIIDFCPVGALVDEAMVYLPRAWRMKRVKTYCPLCERGCEIYAESWEDRIVRIKAIDDTYNCETNIICDVGRWQWYEKFLRDRVEDILEIDDGVVKKIDTVSHGKTPSMLMTVRKQFEEYKYRKDIPEHFVKSVVSVLKGKNKIAFFVTPFATNQELEIISKLSYKLKSKVSIIPPEKGVSDMLLRESRAPNLRGCLNYFTIDEKVLKDRYDTVLCYSMGVELDSIPNCNNLILIDLRLEWLSRNNGTSKKILFFPATTPYEKDGTYINFEGRERNLKPVVVPLTTEKELLTLVFKNLTIS